MAVSNRTKIILWSKAGGYCSFPDCRREMVREATPDDAAVLVGKIAHIVAQQHDGPRGAETPPGGEIDGYQNLILLCGDHHHVIDTQVATYPVAKLLQTRTDHERWVRDTLSREQRFLGTCDEQEFVTERLVTTLLPGLQNASTRVFGALHGDRAGRVVTFSLPGNDRGDIPLRHSRGTADRVQSARRQ